MLTRFRIEVEERTAEQCVLTLANYERALKHEEVQRWALYTTEAGKPVPLNTPPTAIPNESLVDELLGRELVEEVIEFDEGLPGYRARRVVRLTRLDTRSPEVHSMGYGWCAPTIEAVG